MNNDYLDPEDSEIVIEAKKSRIDPVDYSYTERDVILYNLGIGATERDLQWTYEGDDQFAALPTFGVIPQFHASSSISLDFLPNFSPVSLHPRPRHISAWFHPDVGDIGKTPSWRAVSGNKSTYPNAGWLSQRI